MLHHHTKMFLHNEGDHQRNEKGEWENILVSDISNKGLISKLYK